MEDIKKQDPEKPIRVAIMEGFRYDKLKTVEKKPRQSMPNTQDKDGQKAAAAGTKTKQKLVDISPVNNVLILPDGQPDTRSIKKPMQTVEIDLTEKTVKESLVTEGSSFYMEAFDAARRSWVPKVDIDTEGNISMWIVERGETCTQAESIINKLKRGMPVKFTSALVEMEIVDPAIKNKKSVIFYSCAHDSHQVVGHRNFIQLAQLQNKDKLTIRLNIREHIFHSAFMHYFAKHYADRMSFFQRTGINILVIL